MLHLEVLDLLVLQEVLELQDHLDKTVDLIFILKDHLPQFG